MKHAPLFFALPVSAWLLAAVSFGTGACATTPAPHVPAASASVTSVTSVTSVAPGPSALAPPSIASSASPPVASAAPSTTAPGRPRLTYRLVLQPDIGTRKETVLTFVELGRHPLAGSVDTEVIELAAERGNGLAVMQDFQELGVSFAPVETLFPRWTLLVKTAPKQSSTWLLQSQAPPSDRAIHETLAEPAPFREPTTLPKAPKNPPMDREYRYRKSVGGAEVACAAFVHPSPESGDFYDYEHCYEPGVGITELQLHSVWGSYELTLVRPTK